MVTDLRNHTQPYLIRRSAYERTSGWEGFEDFGFAGEDCDIYLKLEEVGTIELLDETLYYYRLHPNRASLVLTDEGAYEMWRRLADKTIARIGLPLKRLNQQPPFVYERPPRPAPTLAMVDFVIDRKSTRLNSSHLVISYAVFCLKKKKEPAQVILGAPSCSATALHPRQASRAASAWKPLTSPSLPRCQRNPRPSYSAHHECSTAA